MTPSFYDQVLLILASASPRRHELLKRYAIPFSVATSPLDESAFKRDCHALNRRDLVEQLAIAKGAAFMPPKAPIRWILSADTLIDFKGQVIGKPASLREARSMLESFCGQSHQVLSALALHAYDNGRLISVDSYVESATVHFYPLNDYTHTLIENYLTTGSYLDKAGAYGIQELSGLLIKRIEGDYHCIMGLPLHSLFHRWPFLLADLSQQPSAQ